MYWQILKSRRPLGKRVKGLGAYARARRGARVAWAWRFKQVFSSNPQLRAEPPGELLKQHMAVWSGFRRKVNLSDLKICANGNDHCDPRIVPEEIFVADIEPTLNGRTDLSLLANKSLYYKLYDPTPFPKAFFHQIYGRRYDAEFSPMDRRDLDGLLSALPYPVLSKPSRGTAGGVGVSISQNPEQLRAQMAQYPDLVIQEIIQQDAFFRRFNHHGLNTIRVNLYRSVSDDSLKFLNCALRMGVGGSLDNETDGGIVCHIDSEGYLTGTARDKFAVPFKCHPDTKLQFLEAIPHFTEMKELALETGEQIPYGRLFSLDLCLDDSGHWRIIEINMHGQTIRFSQYAGIPFFGGHTEEVIEYCHDSHWCI